MFTPPEAFLCDEEEGFSGKRRDLWSIGVILYCMLFGEAPLYSADSNFAAQMKIMTGTVEYPRWFVAIVLEL